MLWGQGGGGAQEGLFGHFPAWQPQAEGQLQWASCLPAYPGSPAPQAAPKIKQIGSSGSGIGVKSHLGIPEKRADPKGGEEKLHLAAVLRGERVKVLVQKGFECACQRMTLTTHVTTCQENFSDHNSHSICIMFPSCLKRQYGNRARGYLLVRPICWLCSLSRASL